MRARASGKPDAKSESDSRDFSAPAPLFPTRPRVYLADRLRPDRPDAKKIAAAQQFIPDRLRRNRRMIHERSAATSNPVGNQEPRRAPPIASAHSRVRRQVYQCYWEQVGRSMDDRRGEGSGADCDSLSYFPPLLEGCSFRCSFVVVFLLVLLGSGASERAHEICRAL